jgi:hypothetical protein
MRLDVLLQASINNLRELDIGQRCGLVWPCKGQVVECRGYRGAEDEEHAATSEIIDAPTLLWLLVPFSGDRCTHLLTDDGRVHLRLAPGSAPATYRVTAATYRQPGHYVCLVRFGDRWFSDEALKYDLDPRFCAGELAVRHLRLRADLKNVLLVRE